jgi:hypothetical protein
MVMIDIHALPGKQSLRDPESFTQIPLLKNEKPQMTQIDTDVGASGSTPVHCKFQSIPIQGLLVSAFIRVHPRLHSSF